QPKFCQLQAAKLEITNQFHTIKADESCDSQEHHVEQHGCNHNPSEQALIQETQGFRLNIQNSTNKAAAASEFELAPNIYNTLESQDLAALKRSEGSVSSGTDCPCLEDPLLIHNPSNDTASHNGPGDSPGSSSSYHSYSGSNQSSSTCDNYG